MKNFIRIILIGALLAGAGEVKSQTSPRVMLLDSVYSSNWVDNNWSLDMKNYRIKDGSGRTIESLFKKFSSTTGQFRDFIRTLNTYQGSDATPTTVTGQLMYPSTWNTLQYTHYLEKEIIDTSFVKNWDSQHHIVSSGIKNTVQYNDSLLPLERTTQSWDTTTLGWLNISRTTYSYTPGMQSLDSIILSWENSTSTWVNIYKYTDVYDANNVLVGQFEYAWNDTSAIWESTVRVTYFNNPTSLPNRMVRERWNTISAQWDTTDQSTYVYNQFNWLMTVISQNYIQNSGQWVNDYVTFYTYTSYGNLQSTTGELWDSIHLTWIPETYQAIDSATQKLAESFTRFIDPQTFLVTSGTRNLYTYNAPGDTTKKVDQQWSIPANDWVDKTQVLYTYDSQNLRTQDLTQIWEPVSSTWINSKKSDYYYSDFIGIDEPQGKAKPCFYANPLVAGKSVSCPYFIDGDQYILRICSLTGMEVFRSELNSRNSCTIPSSITGGLYFLIIEKDNNIIFKDKVVIIQ